MSDTHKTWSCPFFVWDERLAIHCECGRPRFPDYETAEAYIGAYCANGLEWKRCTLAKNMLEYYRRHNEWEESE